MTKSRFSVSIDYTYKILTCLRQYYCDIVDVTTLHLPLKEVRNLL